MISFVFLLGWFFLKNKFYDNFKGWYSNENNSLSRMFLLTRSREVEKSTLFRLFKMTDTDFYSKL